MSVSVSESLDSQKGLSVEKRRRLGEVGVFVVGSIVVSEEKECVVDCCVEIVVSGSSRKCNFCRKIAFCTGSCYTEKHVGRSSCRNVRVCGEGVVVSVLMRGFVWVAV